MRVRAVLFMIMTASLLLAERADSRKDKFNDPAPDFTLRILPIISRVGCNSGQCHGAAGGQGGFGLSLRGYDAAADYDTIVHERGGRRVDVANPENSLILRKPSKQLAHRGGLKLPEDGAFFAEVKKWIENGARPGSRAAPVELLASPAERLGAAGEKYKLSVNVTLADGAKLDVTDTVLFSSNDESIARVDKEGNVEITGSGETAILIKYLNLVTAARVGAKFGCDISNYIFRGNGPGGFAAEMIHKLEPMSLAPAPTLDDEDRGIFYRRVYLDITGTLPDVEDARLYLKHPNPDKYKFFEEIVTSKETITRWTRWLADLLRVREETMGVDGARRAQEYLRSQLEARRPLDEIIREAITAKGEPWAKGPAALALATDGPAAQMEFVTKTFMGARMQCAQCHQHPFDRWSREDYFGLAAFFARVRRDNGKIILSDSGDFTDPKTGKPARPRFPADPGSQNAAYPEIPAGVDRREIFCDWLFDIQDRRFDRVIVNRIWKELYGVGIVDPVDDFRAGNPPSNPKLLDALVQSFREVNRDIFKFIFSLELYNRTAVDPKPGAERDFRYYSHAYIRPLSGPILLDAVAKACGYSLKIGDRGNVRSAQEIPDEDGGNVSLRALGRCPRDGSVDPSIVAPPSLTTALHWIHGPFAKEMIDAPGGRVEKIVISKMSADDAIDELFLATLTRFPTDAERAKARGALGADMTNESVGDLLWALMATSEFVTNH
ncbi:MAG: DUF1549 domain-containing protein [Planctomycetes bacterium]|nr:DUF1549 domain-containing protein [Planctomycetota bacterium]